MRHSLRKHHKAWLSAHPNRSERWFLAKLREGFDIHHLDGDRENNDPPNLVMIEHMDHMALHNGGFYTLGRLKQRVGPSPWSPWEARETVKGVKYSFRKKHKSRQIKVNGELYRVPQGTHIVGFVHFIANQESNVVPFRELMHG